MSEPPPDAARWKNFACAVQNTPSGGFCLQVYARETDGERWSFSQLAAKDFPELNIQLAAALDAAFIRGQEAGLESVRVAIGFPRGSMRR